MPRNALSGVRTRARRCSRAQPCKRARLANECQHFAFETIDGELRLQHVHRGACGRKRLCVDRLMVRSRRGQRHENGGDLPGKQLRRGHGARARERQIRRGVRVRDGRQILSNPNSATIQGRELLERRRPRHPDQVQAVRQAAPHPLRHDEIHGPRPLTPAVHQQHVPANGREPPRGARQNAVGTGRGRGLDGRARIDEMRAVATEHAACLGEREIVLASPPPKRPRRETRVAVARLLHNGNAMRHGVGLCDTGRVATGANHQSRMLAAGQRAQLAPRAQRATHGAPVLPRPRAIERMEIEEQVREFRTGQHRSLDASTRANEERVCVRVHPYERPRDGEPGIEMTTGTTTRKQHGRAHARVRRGERAFGIVTPADRWRHSRSRVPSGSRCSRGCR